MTERDWDAELRKIDRHIASAPAESAIPVPAAARSAPAVAPDTGTSTMGVFFRLALAVALGVAIVFWPYVARCGLGLGLYLGAVGMLLTAGVWASVWTWRHRAAKAHTVSVLLVLWGLTLAAIDVLPRIGYAKPTADHPANWTCS